MIDVTENIKKLETTTDQTFLTGFSDSIKTKTNFAMGGAAIGFIYAIFNRLGWVNYTVGGLVVGALTGYAIDGILNKNNK
jgi:hypothetical protein